MTKLVVAFGFLALNFYTYHHHANDPVIPERESFEQRLTELWDYAKMTPPFRKKDRWFFYRNDGLQNQSVLFVQEGIDGEPRALSESLEGRVFQDDEIPWDDLAFYSTVEALRDFLALEAGEQAAGRSRNLR